MKHKTLLLYTLLVGSGTTAFAEALPVSPAPFISQADAVVKQNNRPAEADRLFRSDAVEKEIKRICKLLTNQRLAWMFTNCFPNTLDTTVHYTEGDDGTPDTFVYTGDIPAMWLRDSGAQVFVG